MTEQERIIEELTETVRELEAECERLRRQTQRLREHRRARRLRNALRHLTTARMRGLVKPLANRYRDRASRLPGLSSRQKAGSSRPDSPAQPTQPGAAGSSAATVTWISRREAINGSVIREQVRAADLILDVGCGIRPQTLIVPMVHICVEPYMPYIERLRSERGHDPGFVFLNSTWDKAMELLPDKSIDSIFALDVLEHLDEIDGGRFLAESERIARKQIVIFTPLGFYPQTYGPGERDRWGMGGAKWQTHRSGWEPGAFGAGWKVMACRDFHRVNEAGEALREPFGALWAFRDLA